MKNQILSQESFSQILNEADQHRLIRLQEIEKFIYNPNLCLFGYGGKGRQIANYLKDNINPNLLIFDHSIERLHLAQSDGFEVIHDVKQIETNSTTTILAACQIK